MLKLSIVVVVIAALVYLLSQYMKPGMCESKDRIDGKVAIVTGGNNGIGRETVRDLVARGGKVYIASRSIERGVEAANDIKNTTGADDSKVVVLQLDLASFQSIRKFSEEFHKREKQLHILVNSAGAWLGPRTLTVEGIEEQFGVNHLGHFLLTNLLADVLFAGKPSRVINVSSRSYQFSSIDFDDINLEKDFGPLRANFRSQLCNVLFSNELARRTKGKGITSYSLGPGHIFNQNNKQLLPPFTSSDIGFEILRFLFKPISRNATEGAQTSICCAVDSRLQHETGKYYEECTEREQTANALDEAVARRLWEVSVKMAKLDNSEIHPLLK